MINDKVTLGTNSDHYEKLMKSRQKSGASTARHPASRSSYSINNSHRPRSKRQNMSKDRIDNNSSINGQSLLSQTMVNITNELNIGVGSYHHQNNNSMFKTQLLNNDNLHSRRESNSVSFYESNIQDGQPRSSVQSTKDHLRSILMSQRDDGQSQTAGL